MTTSNTSKKNVEPIISAALINIQSGLEALCFFYYNQALIAINKKNILNIIKNINLSIYQSKKYHFSGKLNLDDIELAIDLSNKIKDKLLNS